jgi:sulfate transport system permease protein
MLTEPVATRAGTRARGRWTRRLLIGIVLAYLAILILWPLAVLVRGAFAEGLEQFVGELTQPEFLRALGLTLVLAASALVVNTVFGTIVAWVLVRQRFRGRGVLNGLVDLPLVVSPVVAGYMFILLFGRRGWLGPLLAAADIQVVFAFGGMLLATLFVTAPFMIRELMPVLQEIGVEPEQAAYTLGASGAQTFRRVTLPGIRWGLAYGMTLTLARALGEFGAVLVVGGAIVGRTETATIYIYRSMEERQYVAAFASAVALALLSFAVLIVMEYVRRRTESRA